MKESKRLTIGVLVSGILDEFTKSICAGVIKEAKIHDIDIIILPAKYYKRDLSDNPELRYEYQYNMLFNYPTPQNIDALLIAAGSVGCYSTKHDMANLIASFKDIPCILIAYDIEGYVSVNFDNYKGIRDGIEYILTHAGARHFGMIGGNIENTDARERKDCFYSVLAEHGISPKDIAYVEGDFTKRCAAVYKELLDDNPELDAVFCANDDMAIGFYEEAKRRGLQIGKDISILGYDDTILAAASSPPLSTVRADSWRLGEEALKLALSKLNGNEIQSIRFPTGFVKRGSIYTNKKLYTDNTTDVTFESVFYRYMHEEVTNDISVVKNIYDRALASCQKVLQQHICDDSVCNDMITAMNDFVNSGAIEYADVGRIIAILQQIYSNNINDMDKKETSKLTELFFLISNNLSYALNEQFGQMKKDEEKERYEMKLFVQRLLQFEKGTDASYGSLLLNINWLDITDAALYTFEKPIIHLENEGFNLPDKMLLKAVLSEGQVKVLNAYQQSVDKNDIFNNTYYGFDKRTDRIMLPLFCNEILYGVMVCSLTPKLYTNGEFLINQISSAMKVINLLHTNEIIQMQLEENLHTLKKNNVKLDTLSKSDPLTGIYNRRGFYEECTAKLTVFRSDNKNILVLYADMNNLKIINDRYGHNEGDYSLQLIARFLTAWTNKRGITGRIGGDEYACMLEYDDAHDLNYTISKIYEMFDKYNAGSDKPYNISVSAGGYILTPTDTLGLSEALQKADEMLYQEKLKRKKEVAKKSC